MPERRPLGVVLATRSGGKLAELRALFAAGGYGVAALDAVGLDEVPEEDAIEAHATFEANARAKARWFAARLPGRAIVAEDSGLEVEALGGAPGVHSKRWSGSSLSGAALDAENNAALARALEGRSDRRARYVCAAVCVWGAREWTARGTSEGRILEAPRGAGGFGYDPWFFSEELGKTFAEATREEKARVSHRGRAIRALLVQLDAIGSA